MRGRETQGTIKGNSEKLAGDGGTKSQGRTYIRCESKKPDTQPSLAETMKKRASTDAHIEITVPVVVFKDEEDGIWYAHCPVLDVTGYGKTKEEAKDSFEIVLDETIGYMLEHGTLDSELKRLGWGKTQGRPTPPDMSKLLKKREHEELRQMMARKHSLTYSPVPALA